MHCLEGSNYGFIVGYWLWYFKFKLFMLCLLWINLYEAKFVLHMYQITHTYIYRYLRSYIGTKSTMLHHSVI